MKFLIVSISFILITQCAIAQSSSNFDFFLGYGFYEGYNIGSEYYFKKGIHSISLSLGYERSFNTNQDAYSLALAYNFAIFRNHTNSLNQFKWRINNRLVLWQTEDDYYLFRLISLIPTVNRRFILYKKITISLDVGPSFNIVLYNKRKTFEQVGWPYHVMPDFRILFIL